MMLESLLKCMLERRWKTAIFSVTSACNCRCSMCNIPNLPLQQPDPATAFAILRQCVENRVAILSLTGGEPFLYPHLPELVRRAHRMGIFVHIATNGTLPEKIAQVGGHVDAIGFSLDSHISAEHDSNRGHNRAFEKCLKSVKICGELGIKSFANTPPNRYIIDRIEEYVGFVNDELGIPVGFCYPETHGGDYFATCESVISDLRAEQIASFFSAALRLKKQGYDIVNSDIFLREAAAYAREKFERVSRCGGGRVVYWIDWLGKVHPCFNKRTVLNKNGIWEKYDPKNCNECFVQCFREPSSFVYNLPHSLRELRTWKSLF